MKSGFGNILKFFIALIIGGVLGDKLLTQENPLYILIFLAICYVGGVILYRIGQK